MSYSYNVVKNAQTVEYGKFVEIKDDSRFPAISVIRTGYFDNSSAFASNTGTITYSAVDIYPKYGVIAYVANTDEFAVTLSAGQVNLDTQQIEYHLSNLDVSISASNTYLDAIEQNTFDTASATDDTFHEVVQLNTQTAILTTNSYFGTTEDKPLFVTSTPGAPNYITLNDTSQLDAFGRLRVSEPKTLVDAKHLYDKLPLLFTERLSGTATSTFSANDSMVVMRTNAIGDSVARQSRYHFNYQPGKSLQALFTGKLHPQTGIIKRMGLYQSLSSTPTIPSDGIYIEVTENGPYFKVTKTQGTPHTLSFPQSAWNVDKLDGTGASGVTVSLTAAQIFVIDYEWLSLGRVRFGFMQSGKTYYAHYVNHINDLDRPYITSPNQPIRYEIVQTGSSPGVIHHICSTVMVEGGEENIGKPISVAGNVISPIGSAAYKELVAVRLARSAHDSSVVVKAAEVLNAGGNAGMYDIILNPSYVNPPFTWTNLPDTAIQYSTGGATVSGGYSLFKSFVPAGLGGSTVNNNIAIPGEVAKLGIDINDTSDIVVLVGKTLTSPGTTDMVGVFNLLEKS